MSPSYPQKMRAVPHSICGRINFKFGGLPIYRLTIRVLGPKWGEIKKNSTFFEASHRPPEDGDFDI